MSFKPLISSLANDTLQNNPPCFNGALKSWAQPSQKKNRNKNKTIFSTALRLIFK